MLRSRGCGRRSLVARLRDWWDLRQHRYDRMLARLDGLGPDDPPLAVGVREARRPLLPSSSARVALDLPD